MDKRNKRISDNYSSAGTKQIKYKFPAMFGPTRVGQRIFVLLAFVLVCKSAETPIFSFYNFIDAEVQQSERRVNVSAENILLEKSKLKILVEDFYFSSLFFFFFSSQNVR